MEKLAVTLSCHKLTGSFTRKINVTTNDPSHPKQILTCKGQIREPVTMRPRRLNFGRVSRNKPAAPKKVVITPGDGGPLNLKLQPVKMPGVSAQLREIEPAQRYELEVTLTPPFKSDRMVRTNVTLETGVAEAPTATVPVYATITPRVTANPNRVIVPDKRQSDWERAIRLVWEDDAPHKILGATVDDAGMQVRVEETDGRQHVVLQVPRDYKNPSQRRPRTVTIKTDDAQAPEVRVRVILRGGTRSARPGRPATSRPVHDGARGPGAAGPSDRKRH